MMRVISKVLLCFSPTRTIKPKPQNFLLNLISLCPLCSSRLVPFVVKWKFTPSNVMINENQTLAQY